MKVLVEVCVDTTEDLTEAVRFGAGRIELCAALDLGGLTPSAGQMQSAAGLGVPVFAMIRPRAGGFVWSPEEIAVMEADIAAVHAAGLQGVVLGASRPDGRLDSDVLALLIRRAEGLGLTLNRCFDLVPDLDAALEEAVDLGFHRILTSGGARTAAEGAANLKRLADLAAGRITIMPGSGLSADSLPALHGMALREVHASCSQPMVAQGPAVDFGFAPRVGRRLRGTRLRDLRTALERAAGEA